MAESPVILLSGATGQVGFELLQTLAPLGRVVAPLRAELDLANLDAIRDVVRALRPAAIVNAAAYTAVERAEQESDVCARINGEAPGVLAEEAARLGVPMIHFSTDYVFDGRASRPYREDDTPNPLNVYGRTKLAGERAVAAAGGRHVILRTSWVYGARGSNFLRTMLRLGRERSELTVVDDQTGTPTWSRSIARATATVLRHLRGSDHSAPSGIYHLTSAGSATWCTFVEEIFRLLPSGGAGGAPRVIPIATADFPSTVQRPLYSVLDSGMVRERFGVSIADWRSDLATVMAELTTAAR